MKGSPYPLGIQRCGKTKPCPPGPWGLKRGKASKQEPIHNFKANPLLKHTVAMAVVPPRVPSRSIENKDSPQAPKGLGKASCRRRPQPELSVRRWAVLSRAGKEVMSSPSTGMGKHSRRLKNHWRRFQIAEVPLQPPSALSYRQWRTKGVGLGRWCEYPIMFGLFKDHRAKWFSI